MSYSPRILNAQWDAHKEKIRALYLVEDKTLDQTIEIMRERHGFSATDKQYVRKLKAWGMKKNVSSHQWKQSVSLVQRRKALGKETKLTIDGMVISAKKMKKEMSRYSYPQYGHVGMSAVATNASLGIIACTPPSDNAPHVFLDTMPWLRFQSSVKSLLFSPEGKFLLSRLETSLASIGRPPFKFRMQDPIFGYDYTDAPSTIPLGLQERIVTQCNNGQAQQLVQSQPMLQLLHYTVYVSSNSLETMEELVRWITENEYTEAIKKFIQLKGPSLVVFASKLLVTATRLNNVDFVRMLLIQGANPNSVDKATLYNGLVFRTVLSTAVQRRDLRLVELLLHYGADPNDSGHAEQTILDHFWNGKEIEAADTGQDIDNSIRIIEILIKAGGRVTHIDQTFPRSWLVASIKSGNFRLIELLLDAASHLNEPASLINMKMQFEIERNELAMVQGLVGQGAEVNCFIYHYEDGYPFLYRRDDKDIFTFPWLTTPIALAAKKNNFEMTQLLLSLGADANSIAPWDGLPTHMASRKSIEARLRRNLKFGPKPALHHAVFHDNAPMVEILLQYGADVHVKDHFGCTPLHAACHSNHLDVARLLLNWGASWDKTTLQAASQCENSGVLELLLFHSPNSNSDPSLEYGTAALTAAVEIQSRDLVTTLLKTGVYPDPMSLHIAITRDRRSAQIVECLLDAGASVNAVSCNAAQCYCSPWSPITPLQMAVNLGDLELVNLLLQYGADISHAKGINLCSHHLENSQGESLWHELILTLLDYGADINGHDSDKSWTFLQNAVRFESLAVIELLLDRGADPNKYSDPDGPPLYRLLDIGCNELSTMKLLNVLISHGAHVNGYAPYLIESVLDNAEDVYFGFQLDIGDYMQITPLQLAACFSSNDAVTLLLEKGADINSPPAEGFGFTALQIAIFMRKSEVTETLLKSGANINTPAASKIGFTALQAAILTDNNELALRLLTDGAEIDAPASSKKGITSLQAAAFKNNDQLMQALLSRNPNVNAPPCGMNGATALQYAAINGNFDVVLQLLEKGADINAAPSGKEGRTALEGAAEYGRLDIVHLLLENDHDVEFLEERCNKAADFAYKEGHRDIANILRNWERP